MPPDELAIRTAHQRKRLFELSCARGSTTACVTIEPMSGDQQRWCADLKLSSQDGLLVVRAEGLSPHDAVDRAFDELNVAAPAAA